MNHFKVKNKRKNLQFEINFTRAYKTGKSAGLNPAQLELACLQTQYPAIMHDIEDEDLFAGRIEFGAVGLGIQHQTGGFGYFIDEPRVAAELENAVGTQRYREDLHDMLVFWRSENTGFKVMSDMPSGIREALPSDDWLGRSLPACPILRMAGTYLDFDKLVRIGLPGMKEEVRTKIVEAGSDSDKKALFQSMLGALDLIGTVCDFYRGKISEAIQITQNEERRAELTVMAEVLTNIMVKAPQNMREAIQLVWIYCLLTPEIEFGRMDVYLGDLYVQDIENGNLTREKALQLMQSYFQLMDHLDCETDARAIVGGYGRRNTENADRFSLVAIEACRTVKEVLPQFTLRFGKQTPPEIWQAAMNCIQEGRTYPLLYNDEVLIPGIMKAYSVDRERAESYVPLGCGEIEFDHYSFGTPSGSLNILKILEIAIYGGFDPVSGSLIGPATRPLTECGTFEEFYSEFKKHLDYYIAAQADFEMYQYRKAGEIHAFMYVTMLYDGCLERGKAIFSGGCASLNGTLELYGLVNAADSLTAIRRLIFDKKAMSSIHLNEVLAANFFAFEKERNLMINCPKYGNDTPEADDMMVDLHRYTCRVISDQAVRVGLDTNLAVVINNAQNTTLARWVGASADGRKAGTAMANANNPAPGMDKNGITAMLNSILKLPHDNMAGMVQNIRFSRELFESSKEKVQKLINHYFEQGGAQAMISVVGREELADAIIHPEKYHDLIVRVGGFSARFVDLPKDVQKEIFERVTY